ncbi:hypothetical protein MTO96_001837, partial [Rhipicephalus appendiculatus]
CHCSPDVVIRPLTLSETRFRIARRKRLEHQVGVPPTPTEDPFTVVLKRHRIEQSVPSRAAPSTKQLRTKQLTLPEMIRKVA